MTFFVSGYLLLGILTYYNIQIIYYPELIELFNSFFAYLKEISFKINELFNTFLIYLKEISFKINELLLFIYTIPFYLLYVTILSSTIIWVKNFKPELWKTKSDVFFKSGKRLLMIYSTILAGAILIYILYINTTFLDSISIDPNWKYNLYLFRVLSIFLVIYVVIYKQYIKPRTKEDASEYLFSFCVGALLAILVNVLFSLFFSEFIIVWIGEGSSGSSGSNSSDNNPGGGEGPKPPRPPIDYSSILWKTDDNSEASSSKSSVPAKNSETSSNSSKRLREETGKSDNPFTKRVRQPSANDNRYMTVLQQVEDYSVAKLRAIKAELIVVKRELQEMEDIIKKVPGGLGSVPANMEWHTMQNPRPNHNIDPANPPFHIPEGVSSFYEYDLTGIYNVKEDRSISAEYAIKIRQRVELEREFAHLKSVSLKIREAAPTGVVRAKYFPKN